VQRIIRIACAPLACAAALGALPHLELVPLIGPWALGAAGAAAGLL
jgi:hypothetical protein